MNILLISQCSGRAIVETRRIIDQFAERRGDNVWQTAITQQGLETLYANLRKTARKNTAVACHWIHGKNHSELLWIVGNLSRFNESGAVPTNMTTQNILRRHDENDWHTTEAIRLMASLAALFHDMGKGNDFFQNKLKNAQMLADPFRHEWVSLRLFEAFVGKQSDKEWLERLANIGKDTDTAWKKNLITENIDDAFYPSPFESLPPFASVIGWLIAGHHSLPVSQKTKNESILKDAILARLPLGVYASWCGSGKASKNGRIQQEKETESEKASKYSGNQQAKDAQKCWNITKKNCVFASSSWQQSVQHIAHRLLAREDILNTDWWQNTFALHMARLALMFGDHYYSSLTGENRFAKGNENFPAFANTMRNAETQERTYNQRLDEHLIGVAKVTGHIARIIPHLEHNLPRLGRHKILRQRTTLSRFQWQNKAYDLACGLQQASEQHGFFGVNLASTGYGKTLANGRIMYGLSNPALGARFAIALGLRTLTLQTGDEYRRKLGLGSETLAVMIGSTAVKDLHEMHAEEQFFSDSKENTLLPESTYVHFEGSLEHSPLNKWMHKMPRAKSLLCAPLLVCTIDHLMPATEGIRGGRQIIPMLRLLTSDLVLDEPDDFGMEDLHALTRLVHWSGMLGNRILLSSATLPPSLVQGLFEAYRAGRNIYNTNRLLPTASAICCAWFDEFGAQSAEQASQESFAAQHKAFVEKRIKKLSYEEVRRKALIQTVTELKNNTQTSSESQKEKELLLANSLAANILEYSKALHNQHHTLDPASQKKVSFGLVRMANIDPLIDVVQAFLQKEADEDTQIHVCCYHSHHPFFVRSAIEHQLDTMLNRKDEFALYSLPLLRKTLDSSQQRNHIFIVFATAVAEVGRDHDYDWAIVEPSSMRSIIQLAGRIRRHREGECQNPNMYLLHKNIKALKGESPAFCRPGFETKGFNLQTHSLCDVLEKDQLANITSVPRIQQRTPNSPRTNLVDLEHERIQAVMVDDPEKRTPPAHRWWTTHAHLSGELQRVTPFRKNINNPADYNVVVDENVQAFSFEMWQDNGTKDEVNHLFTHMPISLGVGMNFWLDVSYVQLLHDLAERLGMDVSHCAVKFGNISLPTLGAENGWLYHENLGFKRHT